MPDVDPAATDPLAAFAWHPEPELVGITDPARSRAALEALGEATWREALDYLYDHAQTRSMGEPVGYDELRRVFFGESLAPAAAPRHPLPSASVLLEFRKRLAPFQLNAFHPRALSYFTPPPLVASIAGEVLAQWTNQGVDVWHAGPTAAFVEEEVIRWLCDLVDYPQESFGLLASGGVMANFMALVLARDVQLRRLRSLDRPPRGAALEGARVYVSDQGPFSV